MRADKLLVARGLFASRAQAQAAIRAGRVRADGRVVAKVSEPLSDTCEIEAGAAHPWVGRGGLKLDHALEVSGLDVSGAVALDVGSSTGGFTDVLLARGAAKVFAVDVGRDQLAERLRADPRVVVREGMDARELTVEQVGHPDVVVCDASFISLASVLPVPLELARAGAVAVALVKPQFEVGRAGVSRGGVVRDAGLRSRAVSDAAAFLEGEGWTVEGFCESPVTGGAGRRGGNRESLIWARKTG